MFVEAKIFVSLRAICLSAKNSRVDVDADASLLALHQKWIILSLKLVIRQPQKNYFTVKKWLLARVDNKNNNLFNFLHRLWTLVQLADEVSFYLLVSLIPRLLLLKLDKQPHSHLCIQQMYCTLPPPVWYSTYSKPDALLDANSTSRWCHRSVCLVLKIDGYVRICCPQISMSPVLHA